MGRVVWVERSVLPLRRRIGRCLTSLSFRACWLREDLHTFAGFDENVSVVDTVLELVLLHDAGVVSCVIVLSLV